MSQLGEVIREERQRLGKSRRIVEDESGVSQRRQAEIEKGDDNVTLRTLRSLVGSLGDRVADAARDSLVNDTGRYRHLRTSHAA